MEYEPINTKWPFTTLQLNENFSTSLINWAKMRSLAVYYHRKHGKQFSVNKISDSECKVTRVK